jgi:O-Antigen ligase
VGSSDGGDRRRVPRRLTCHGMSALTEVVATARPPAQRLVALWREYAITVAVAVVVVLVGYDNGGFGESTRDTLAILLWWLLIICVAIGVWPLTRVPRAAWAVGGLLALFGLWTLLSVFWAADAAGAYSEFTRVLLYLAVFAVTVAGSRRDNAGHWLDGLALGIAVITVVALVSRLFPGTLSQPEIEQLLGGTATRLSFPVGYWNGLATFVALGIPLLLRIAVVGRSIPARAAAVLPIPAICGVIYLTSSRIGVVSAVIGAAAFVLFAPKRWTALGAAVVASAGAAAVVLALYQRNTLVNGPLDSAVAESQGRGALLIILGTCALSALVYGVACRTFEGNVQTSRALGWTIVLAVVVLAVAGLVAADPVRRFEQFKNPDVSLSAPSAIEQHLLSGSGNGRWQLWSSALDEFESSPFHGRGAGSFQAWWRQHGSLPLFVQDAHSLYAETLGELGVFGFALLVAMIGVALVAGVMRLVRAGPDHRSILAAAVSAVLVFLAAAAFDWAWELTIIAVVAFVCLALLVSPGTSSAFGPRRVQPGEESDRRPLARYGLGVGVIVAGWLLICAIGIQLLAGARISASQDASARGDLAAAVRAASDARSIQPWSSAPYRQLALLEEQGTNYGSALGWIRDAISRNRSDWTLWLIQARLQLELGHVRAARHSLERVKVLYPGYGGR